MLPNCFSHKLDRLCRSEIHVSVTIRISALVRFVCMFQLLQSESDGMEIELRRKEASLDLISTEKNKVLDRLTEEESKWLFCTFSH